MRSAVGILLSFACLTPVLGSNAGRLINGAPANASEWPSSVYVSMGGGRCSGTLVGYRVLLIASHCVSNGGSASFTVNSEKYTAKCTHGPGYPSNSTADWSLCLTDKVVAGGPFEQVNFDSARVQMGAKLTLTGYGCIKKGGGGGNDGVFRIGEATVTKLPSGSNHDIVTEGGAALCFGDSGGSAYYIDPTDGRRWVVGINSRGDISTTSYLSSISTDTVKDFMKDWSKKNDQVICGINMGAGDCRN